MDSFIKKQKSFLFIIFGSPLILFVIEFYTHPKNRNNDLPILQIILVQLSYPCIPGFKFSCISTNLQDKRYY